MVKNMAGAGDFTEAWGRRGRESAGRGGAVQAQGTEAPQTQRGSYRLP